MLFATAGGPKQQPMYRYSVDNAVTYTSEDIVLFRESPFACWMERLTLENPHHGILPDRHSHPPANSMERQDELAETLRAEGKNVRLIDWEADEPGRRNRTLEAMRQGVDFIVNGQLALGPLSGSANLLMRTSGYSELGNYLYIPCDTQAKTTINSAFRLCFLADLLHSLQGQLPPKMLIIRGGSDLVPLETEDHIYHYRAVKQRFMQTMRDFRKHRMPDPAESAQFGRWGECANEVLRQRALQGDESGATPLEQAVQEEALPLQATAGTAQPVQPTTAETSAPERAFGSRGIQVGDTLASQAQQLSPRAYQTAESDSSSGNRILDSALQNLEFIGSSQRAPSIGGSGARLAREPGKAAPTPALAEPLAPESAAAAAQVTQQQSAPKMKPHPLDSSDLSMPVAPPLAERETPALASGRPGPAGPEDSPPVLPTTPPPVLHTDSPEFEVDCVDDSDYALPMEPDKTPVERQQIPDPLEEEPQPEPSRPFSSSLNTADFEDI